MSNTGVVEQKVTFKDFVIDVDLPMTQFVSPASRTTTRLNTDIELSGWAKDGLGVRAVRVAIFDPDRLLFWNGSEWQSDYVMLNSSLNLWGAPDVTWRISFTPETTSGNVICYARTVTLDGRYDSRPRILRFSWAK
ncbi:MAG: hypothetical protein R3C03_02865 [Pirellulaceae bacterium]